ncbi:hypothetical protein BDV97DRAFT_387970 [Delphinella strobiligena]|nr:hypothetical protein BDV97DRAFT_387970 [Delphinella strobiligena]
MPTSRLFIRCDSRAVNTETICAPSHCAVWDSASAATCSGCGIDPFLWCVAPWRDWIQACGLTPACLILMCPCHHSHLHAAACMITNTTQPRKPSLNAGYKCWAIINLIGDWCRDPCKHRGIQERTINYKSNLIISRHMSKA